MESSGIKPVAGTNLHCLEDPVFEFEHSKIDNSSTSIASTLPASSQLGGYHVLEATEAPIASTHSSTNPGASDVLEKARNRFDKFWGKGTDD